ncbi:hypothetical protein BG000_011530 [Podila horticola]|nr:hypothetical protein BG000_011530 [Podila horticola]
MAQLGVFGSSVNQNFRSKDGTPLGTLPSHLCPETGQRYVLWNDVQDTFHGVVLLEINWGQKAQFMINKHGELYDPLRIQHVPDSAYIVPAFGTNNMMKSTQNTATDQLYNLERLIQTYEELCSNLKYTFEPRESFRQKAVTVGYFYSEIMEEIERLNKDGVTLHSDEKDRDQLLTGLHELQRQVCERDYQNICDCTLENIDEGKDPAPRFFIVLPSDSDAWDDSDPSTHHFRLYFMCDIKWNNHLTKDTPQHMHLASHPGYNLNRPQEFFQTYGDYVLRMLRIVRSGHNGAQFEVPPLNTAKILWSCDPSSMDSYLSKDTIRPLVDRAISYLEQQSPPTWFPRLGLSRTESAKIKTYLDVQDSDNAEGNLFRRITNSQNVYWMCQGHAYRRLHPESLERLELFVYSHGGHIDVQKAALKVKLRSKIDADLFCSDLASSGYTLDISIELGWKASRSCLTRLCCKLGKTAVLHIEGITVDIHSQSHIDYMTNLFADRIIPQSYLQFVTLHNYPRPQEQCIYSGGCSIQSTSTQLAYDWMGLRSDLEIFHATVSEAPFSSDWVTSSKDLMSSLAKHGFADVAAVNIHHDTRQCVFDLKRASIVDTHVFAMGYDEVLVSSGSLRKLTIDTTVPKFNEEPCLSRFSRRSPTRRKIIPLGAEFDENELERAVQVNKELQELSVSIQGGDEIGQIVEYVIRTIAEGEFLFK